MPPRVEVGEHAELETQMLVAERRWYARAIDMADFNTLSAQVAQLTRALLRSLGDDATKRGSFA